MKPSTLTLTRSLCISLFTSTALLFACGGSDGALGEGSQPITGDEATEGDDASNPAACELGTAPASADDCQAVAKGLCFSTAAAACACAGCSEDNCLVAESFPVQVSCQSGGDDPGSSNPDEPVSSDP